MRTLLARSGPWRTASAAGLAVGVWLLALNLRDTARAYEHLALETDRAGRPIDPHELTRLVASALEHGPPVPLHLHDNWLLWFGGLLVPDLRMSQSPLRLANGGRGLCSDAVIVLNALAVRAGYDARMFDLNGHVVSELRVRGSTWVADPDLGLVHEGSVADISAPDRATEMRRAVLAAGYDEGIAQACAASFETALDNRPIPAGVLSPRHWRAEQASEWLRWLLPAGLVACAATALVRMRA